MWKHFVILKFSLYNNSIVLTSLNPHSNILRKVADISHLAYEETEGGQWK